LEQSLSLRAALPHSLVKRSLAIAISSFVEILTTEAIVTGRGTNLDDPFEDFEQRDIERAATEIEYKKRVSASSL